MGRYIVPYGAPSRPGQAKTLGQPMRIAEGEIAADQDRPVSFQIGDENLAQPVMSRSPCRQVLWRRGHKFIVTADEMAEPDTVAPTPRRIGRAPVDHEIGVEKRSRRHGLTPPRRDGDARRRGYSHGGHRWGLCRGHGYDARPGARRARPP